MKARFNKFLTLLAVLLFGFGQMWGAVTYSGAAPETATYGEDAAEKTFLDVANTTTNATIKTGSVGVFAIDMNYLVRTWQPAWLTIASGSPSNSSYSFSNITDYGFLATASSSSYDAYTQSYGYAQVSTTKKLTFYVTGITGIALLQKDNAAAKKTIITVQEYNADGTLGTAYTTSNSTGNTSIHVLTYDGSILSSSKYYQVTIEGNNSSSCTIYQIRFVPGAATTYTVTYALNGGTGSTPTETAKVAGAKFTLHDGVTGITAPTDKEFDGWHDGTTKYAGGAEYTMGTSDVTLTAQWKDAGAASDDATLSALSVAGCTLNETFASATEDYTVDLPFYASMPVVGDVTATKNDANAEDPVVSISSNVITIHCEAEDGTTKDYTITVTIAPAPAASSSINIEQLILDNSKAYNIGAALDAAHIGYVSKDALDSLKSVAEKADRNEPYLGLKFKTPTSKVTIIVPDGEYLKVKFGYIDGSAGLKVSVNGSAAAAPSLTSGVYTLAASAGIKEVVFTQTGSNKTVVYKQIKINEDVDAVTLPWLVTYTVGEHGTCAKAKETWKGSALTLPAVTPESGWDFDGWFTAASAGTKVGDAGDSYTPTADVELFAQYTAQASPFDLTALTYKIGTGAAQNVGYVDGTFTYNIELPYAHSYDAITVTPTLKEATSYLKGDEVLTVTSLPGVATFTVVENGGASEQLYTINFTKAAKDGVSIIKAVATATGNLDITGENLTGVLKGAAHSYTSGSYKFDTKRYFMLQLKDGEDFQAGDVVEINVSTVNDANGFTLYSAMTGDDFAAGDLIIDTHDGTGAAAALTTGIHKVTLPGSYAGSNKLYVARAGGTDKYLNAGINQVEVKRSMNPVLTAIQFNSTDVEVTSTTVAATLPQGTNLGTMTVTPTIVWNGAGSAAPTAAWAWGANTYRVTDKDGDYTDYTITLTEALAPSAAPTITTQPVDANYYEGATIDALEVVATGSGDLTYQWFLGSDEIDGATNATYTPTVTAIGTYVYHCVVTNTEAGHPATSLASDEATITISEDPAAIKLLDGSTVNHTNFITGVTAEKVTISEVEYDCVKFSGTVSGVNGVKDLTRVIAYNATTNQTKIKLSLYNTSTSSRTVQVKGLVEGADAAVDLAAIELGNKEQKVSDWIEFNNAANRTIYIFIPSSAGDVRFLQVKVIESGATPMKQAGEIGYAINLNKGRLFGPKETALAFEGFDLELSSDYQPINTTYAKIKESSISFTVAAPMLLSVTTSNNKTYYVTKGSAGTDNETAKTGVSEFDLTAGTWYITGGTSEVQITNIAFTLPKCEKPVFNALANSELCSGEPFEALDGTGTVSDGGTITYEWFAEGESTVLATTATFTPSADGSYFVVATHSLDGFTDNVATSDVVTVTHFDIVNITSAPKNVRDDVGNPATLTVAATGKNLSYQWYTCDDVIGTNPVEIPGETNASLDVTVLDETKYYKVTVFSDCGDASVVAKVEKWVDFTQVNVSENTTWDFSTCADAQIKLDGTTTPAKGAECLMANIRVNGGVHYDDPAFNAQALIFAGEYICRDVAGKPLGVIILKFTTTVDGFVTVRFADNGSNNRCLRITDSEGVEFSQSSASNSDIQEFTTFVHAGDVEIMGMSEDRASERQYMRFFNLKFEKVDYNRAVTTGRYGTICLPNGGVMKGADLYEVAYYGETSKKIFFDEILGGVMEAGVPYVFLPKAGYKYLGVEYTDALNAPAGYSNGLHGSYTTHKLDANDGNYILYNNQYLYVDDDNASVGANRAYIRLGEITPTAPALAPGRRRISMGVTTKDEAQGFENIESGDAPMKVMINGTLYILRGEKVFDATGKLVK